MRAQRRFEVVELQVPDPRALRQFGTRFGIATTIARGLRVPQPVEHRARNAIGVDIACLRWPLCPARLPHPQRSERSCDRRLGVDQFGQRSLDRVLRCVRIRRLLPIGQFGIPGGLHRGLPGMPARRGGLRLPRHERASDGVVLALPDLRDAMSFAVDAFELSIELALEMQGRRACIVTGTATVRLAAIERRLGQQAKAIVVETHGHGVRQRAAACIGFEIAEADVSGFARHLNARRSRLREPTISDRSADLLGRLVAFGQVARIDARVEHGGDRVSVVPRPGDDGPPLGQRAPDAGGIALQHDALGLALTHAGQHRCCAIGNHEQVVIGRQDQSPIAIDKTEAPIAPKAVQLVALSDLVVSHEFIEPPHGNRELAQRDVVQPATPMRIDDQHPRCARMLGVDLEINGFEQGLAVEVVDS